MCVFWVICKDGFQALVHSAQLHKLDPLLAIGHVRNLLQDNVQGNAFLFLYLFFNKNFYDLYHNHIYLIK